MAEISLISSEILQFESSLFILFSKEIQSHEACQHIMKQDSIHTCTMVEKARILLAFYIEKTLDIICRMRYFLLSSLAIDRVN
jgi:hypothetical protein